MENCHLISSHLNYHCFLFVWIIYFNMTNFTFNWNIDLLMSDWLMDDTTASYSLSREFKDDRFALQSTHTFSDKEINLHPIKALGEIKLYLLIIYIKHIYVCAWINWWIHFNKVEKVPFILIIQFYTKLKEYRNGGRERLRGDKWYMRDRRKERTKSYEKMKLHKKWVLGLFGSCQETTGILRLSILYGGSHSCLNRADHNHKPVRTKAM